MEPLLLPLLLRAQLVLLLHYCLRLLRRAGREGRGAQALRAGTVGR
jgi:hypothetical protein